MTDFDKNIDAVELSLEAMDQVAGGASGGRKLRVTREAKLRQGPRVEAKAIETVPSGTIIEHYQDGPLDDRGVKWYVVILSRRGSIGYISSKCCEFI